MRFCSKFRASVSRGKMRGSGYTNTKILRLELVLVAVQLSEDADRVWSKMWLSGWEGARSVSSICHRTKPIFNTAKMSYGDLIRQ